MEPPTPYPEHLRELVEAYLEALDFSPAEGGDLTQIAATQGLVDAMRHSLLAGGTRIRPVLALATCEGLGRPAHMLLPTAAAIELVHTYSLIHDDLPAMEGGDVRRGGATPHRPFGEDTAILAGDALFAEALRLVAERQPGGPEARVGILLEISRAAGVAGMAGRQYRELGARGRSPEAGRLISIAVDCAIVLLRPEPAVAAGLRRYARELGLLLRIVDDILGAEGSAPAPSGTVGARTRPGTTADVGTHGLEGARRSAEQAHARALEALVGLPDGLGALGGIADLALVRRD
jgi:geranylgeranyl diphosphate synthase type II